METSISQSNPWFKYRDIRRSISQYVSTGLILYYIAGVYVATVCVYIPHLMLVMTDNNLINESERWFISFNSISIVSEPITMLPTCALLLSSWIA